HIKELPQVGNYELPHVPEDYVHRIGRTARAGGSGSAVSLVSPDETPLLKDIERMLKRVLPVAVLPEFQIIASPPGAPGNGSASQDRQGNSTANLGRPGGGGGRGRPSQGARRFSSGGQRHRAGGGRRP